MAELEVLVSVPTGDGIAGVVRDEHGAVWLSWRIDRLGGPRLDDYRPSHMGLGDDRTLIGGRLVAGAVGAEVVDDAGRRITAAVGDGAWVAVLEQPVRGPIAPAWCWDADRRALAAALPADWPRTRVSGRQRAVPGVRRHDLGSGHRERRFAWHARSRASVDTSKRDARDDAPNPRTAAKRPR